MLFHPQPWQQDGIIHSALPQHSCSWLPGVGSPHLHLPALRQTVKGCDQLHLNQTAHSSSYLTYTLFPLLHFHSFSTEAVEPPALHAEYLPPHVREHLCIRLGQNSKDSFAMKNQDGARP